MDDDLPETIAVLPEPEKRKRKVGRPRKADSPQAREGVARKAQTEERLGALDEFDERAEERGRASAKAEESRQKQTREAVYFLTPSELKFVQAKAAGKTDEDAIREAGYRGSSNRAKVRAHRLMKRPIIRASVYELVSRAFDETKITVEQILREYAFVAFLPEIKLDGKFTPAHKMEALKRMGEFRKIFDRTSPEHGPKSILQLIVQSGGTVTMQKEPAQPVAVIPKNDDGN